MTSDRPRIVRGNASSRPRGRLAVGCFLLGLILGFLAAGLVAGPTESKAPQGVESQAGTEGQNEQLSQDLAVAERARQVSENALQALKQSVFELDQQMANQREEVSFYQRLLDAGGSVRGLAVHEFQLAPTTSARVFRYRLVLTQNLKKTRRVEGVVTLSVTGISGDRAARLDASALGVSPPLQAFKFKYYQLLEGTLSLPEGFSPTEVVVRAEIDESSRSAQEAFPWRLAGSKDAAASQP
ncbi:MAG: DUF6776 family protein [Lysobacterales bacterium]